MQTPRSLGRYFWGASHCCFRPVFGGVKMSLKLWKFLMLSFFFLGSLQMFAADSHNLVVDSVVSTTDQQAYCAYIIEQAEAQRDLLRTPAAVGGMTQPETGLPLQL